MEKQVLKTSLKELSPLINGCLNDGLDVTFTVTGNSMQPLLTHNRDQVVLKKPVPSEIRRFDVPLYIRKNGQYVLHRIVEVRDDTYTMLGDAQRMPEKGILPEQIVAVAKGFYRKGKYIDCNSRLYRCWAEFWWISRGIRPYLLRAYHVMRRMRGANGNEKS